MDRCTVKDARLEGQRVQRGEAASLAKGVVKKVVIRVVYDTLVRSIRE